MTGRNHIGFALSSLSDNCFQAVNPATGQKLDSHFYVASTLELEQAVELAVRAFPVFSRISILRRAEFLKSIGEEILLEKEEILDRYILESGLSRKRGELELQRTIFQLCSYADDLLKGEVLGISIDISDSHEHSSRPDIRKMNVAIGPVVVFGASNFPLAYSTAGGDTASALAAGCPVIVKAHPLHPGTSFLVAEAIVRAARRTEMPEGVFSHLFDDRFEVGKQLVSHDGIKAVGFTGSFKGGMALVDLANKRKNPIPVFAEMGSVNPIVVLPSVLNMDPIEVASKIALSVTNDAGQFCTKPGIVLVKREIALDGFVMDLCEKVKEALPRTMLSDSIYLTFNNTIQSLNDSVQLKQRSAPNLEVGQGIPAVLELNQLEFLSDKKYSGEIFGPITVIVRYDNDEGLEQCLNQLFGQLTCSVFGSLEELQDHSVLLLQMQEIAGRVIVNGVPTGVTVCPSMHHGGPFPAASDSRFTAVGSDAIKRFLRPVAFQNFPNSLLPDLLQNENPLKVTRRINGRISENALVHKKD